MTKGIYFYVSSVLYETSIGVSAKILNQINLFVNSEIEITKIIVNSKSNIIDKMIFFFPCINSKVQKQELCALNILNLNNYDFIYIRKPELSRAIVKLLSNIKKSNPHIKIVMEIPTYPFYGEYRGIRKLFIFSSKLIESKLKKNIDRIVTYSNDDFIFGIETIKISNCIDLKKIKPRIPEKHDDNTINIIAVAHMSFWHGYDRFIEGMRLYYKNKGNRNLKIHLVGPGSEILYYRQLTVKYNLEKHVVFWGKRTDIELDEIYNIASIGLDALGRHRSNVFYNSSLKGKEYGAKGLPIVSGVSTELDYDVNYKYYLRIPSNDEPVNIEDIISFYDRIYTDENEQDVANKIRKYTEKFDYTNGYKTLLSFLRSKE